MSESVQDIQKNNVEEYLKKLAKRYRKLSGTKIPAEIIIVGGAAILMNYNFRQRSEDIDAMLHATSAMKEA